MCNFCFVITDIVVGYCKRALKNKRSFSKLYQKIGNSQKPGAKLMQFQKFKNLTFFGQIVVEFLEKKLQLNLNKKIKFQKRNSRDPSPAPYGSSINLAISSPASKRCFSPVHLVVPPRLGSAPLC